MGNSKYSVCWLSLLFCLTSLTGWSLPNSLDWQKVAKLPPAKSGVKINGLAGVFAGINEGVMIVAGGADFPEKPPWEGGKKKWFDDVYVLTKSDSGAYSWKSNIKFHLPVPLAYGVSVSTEEGVLCVGGNNAEGNSTAVFMLSWQPEVQQIKYVAYPSLPAEFTADAGGKIGNSVYIHGVEDDRNVLLFLDLGNRTWKQLPGCPGKPRLFTASAVQSNGETDCFYLFSGRCQTTDRVTLFSDGYSYNPISKEWRNLGAIRCGGDSAMVIMGGSAVAVGANHILLIGGDAGVRFKKRFCLEKAGAAAQDTVEKKRLGQALTEEFISHPGFSKQILAYHALTNTFVKIDPFPGMMPVTTKALNWDQEIFLVSGEIKPGVRTPVVWKGSVSSPVQHFGWINYLVLLLYFLVLIIIGIYFSRRQKSTADYFKGGSRIPWWAAGLSLFGTSLSAITFMAIPAKTYASNWLYFFFQLTPLLVAPIIVGLYIPFFRRLNVTTAYEYLEKRFNLATRLLGSFSFIIFQLGRVGIVLYLPALALNIVTDINISFCILGMGIISIIYTMIGGIEAVIWTDVLQVIVLMGGAILCLLLIIFQTDGGIPAFYDIAADHHKLKILDASFDFREPTIWVVILGGFFANLISSGSDQTMVQRYLTTKDEKGAAKSAWTFAWLAIPATIIFFGLGTALFVFYNQHPGELNAGIAINDAILPWYIINELPAGISGLIVAGLFSAAMSSLSSSMNSAATAFTTDFYGRFKVSDTVSELGIARMATLIFGVAGTAFAMMMASWDIKSLWDQFQLYIGLFAGGLGGLFLLGITTKKANGAGAIIGLVSSGAVQYYLSQYTSMNVLLFTMSGFVSCYLISYLTSFLLPGFSKNLTGLTVYSENTNRRSIER